jgi:hypothetical protein
MQREQAWSPTRPKIPCDGGLRCAVRGLTAQLAAAQGFTLSIGGTLAATIGQRGGSDLFDVWLFVAGRA